MLVLAVLGGGAALVLAAPGAFGQVAAAQTSTLIGTSVAVTSSAAPSVIGQPVTFTAVVTPTSGTATPTSPVTFTDGARVLGTATWWFGRYRITVSDLTVGTHTVTATYTADTRFQTSSASLSQVVTKGTYAVAFSSTVNPTVTGQATQLKSTVTSTTPGASVPVGTVTYRDGTRVLGTAAWWFGSYTSTVSDLTPGAHALSATFDSTSALTPATASLTQTVSPATTSVALSSSTTPAVAGDAVTLKAVVAVAAPGIAAPTGAVVFSEGATVLGSATPYLGTATLLLPQLTVGSHVITASYAGDAATKPSAASLTQTITLRPTAVTLVTSINPVVTGQTATLKATVSTTPSALSAPTGSVTFRDGTTVLGTAGWWFGAYSLRLPTLSGGDHVITATYSGDARYAPSSASLTQQVRIATTVAATASPAPSTPSDTVTLSVVVRQGATGPAPTGSVVVRENGATIATGTLAQGAVAVPLSGLAAGDHTLALSYGGDGVNAPGSGTTTLVVRIASTLSITSSANPSQPGQPVTITVSVLPRPAGGPVATGSVSVFGGITNAGNAPLVDGVATVTLPALEAGDHLVTASYTGDGLFRAATGTLAQVAGSPTTPTTESAPLTITAQPPTWRPVSASADSLAAKYSGDGGNQIRLPSDGNLLWGSSDYVGVSTDGTPFMLNNVVSISSPSNPYVQRQPMNAKGVPYQLIRPSTNGPCTAPGSARVVWNAGMVAIPQVGWDKVLIFFQSYCLLADGSLTPQSVGVAEFDYSPALANDMVHPWSDHVRILNEDLFAASAGMRQPELGPDGFVYVYNCYTNGGSQPKVSDLLGCKVGRVAPLDVADASRYRFWDGSGWSATSAAAGAYMSIGDVVSPSRLPAGMFKVTYIAQANLWVLGAQAWPGFAGMPLFRVSRSPQGPWSVPAAMPYPGCDTLTGHACYGSMVSPTLSDASQLTVVYFDKNGQQAGLNAPQVATATTTALPDTSGGQLHAATASITMPSPTSGPIPPAPVPTATSMAAPTISATGGEVVRVTATVVPAPTAPDPAGVLDTRTPAGSVTYSEGSTVLATAVRFFDVYTTTLPTLPAGSHTITATFSGDDAFAPSSTTFVVTVQKATTTLTMTSSANPSTYTKAATVSAVLGVVAPGAGTPSGPVTFREGTTVLGTANLFWGSYNLALPNLPVGSHVITASFAGDAVYLPSSTTITQTVVSVPTTLTIQSSAPTATVGTPVKLSATISSTTGIPPTATVTFREGATVLGTGTWWFGAYNLTLGPMSAGSHTITATYAGDASYASSTGTIVQVFTA